MSEFYPDSFISSEEVLPISSRGWFGVFGVERSWELRLFRDHNFKNAIVACAVWIQVDCIVQDCPRFVNDPCRTFSVSGTKSQLNDVQPT